MKRILIVDDDIEILNELEQIFSQFFYDVTTVSSAKDFMTKIKKPYDIIITDIMMPNIDGYDVFKLIKEQYPQTPILFYSALSSDIDEVKALEMGAIDYITKPSNPRVILARVKKALEKGTPSIEQHVTAYEFDNWHVCLKSQRVTDPDGVDITFTAKSFALLCHFLSKPNELISRDDIMNLLYQHDYESNFRNIDTFIYKLRKHLRDEEQIKIKTLHGKGYMLVADVRQCCP